MKKVKGIPQRPLDSCETTGLPYPDMIDALDKLRSRNEILTRALLRISQGPCMFRSIDAGEECKNAGREPAEWCYRCIAKDALEQRDPALAYPEKSENIYIR